MDYVAGEMMTYETYSIISIFCILGVFIGVLMVVICGIVSIATPSRQAEINMMYGVISGIFIVTVSLATGAVSQQLWRMAFFSGTL